jgi:hypothetical protein
VAEIINTFYLMKDKTLLAKKVGFTWAEQLMFF